MFGVIRFVNVRSGCGSTSLSNDEGRQTHQEQTSDLHPRKSFHSEFYVLAAFLGLEHLANIPPQRRDKIPHFNEPIR